MVVAAYVGCLTHVWRLVQCRWANLDTLDGGTAHLVATQDHMVVDVHRMTILDTTLVVTRMVVDVAWQVLVVLDAHVVGVACHQVMSTVPRMLKMTVTACNCIDSLCQMWVSRRVNQIT